MDKEVENLSESEEQSLKQWEEFFKGKYRDIGVLVKDKKNDW